MGMKARSIFLLLGVSGILWGQPGRPAEHRDNASEGRVILFAGTHFSGESIELRSGQYLDDLNFTRFPDGRIANNRISSILIEGNAWVELFDYRSFQGERVTLRSSISDLSKLYGDGNEAWNNRLSSVRVEAGRPRFPQPPPPRPIPVPAPRPRPHDREIDPAVEMVKNAYRDVLHREPDLDGLSTFTRTVQNRGWSESRLRAELRRSDEFRTVTAPRLVTEAYREILQRAPDPAGLQFYVAKMTRDEWSESRVRDALRSSPEYRNRPRSNPGPGGHRADKDRRR